MNIIKHAPNLCDLDMIHGVTVQKSIGWGMGMGQVNPNKASRTKIYIYTHTQGPLMSIVYNQTHGPLCFSIFSFVVTTIITIRILF